VVNRFYPCDGEKEYLPLSFAEHPRYGRAWRWKGLPKPRPLYGLDRLAARPDAPVVLAEGEKAADAAGELLPNHVATASLNGAEAAKVADWSALAGRRVVIWPDADAPGQIYVNDVLTMLGQLSPAPSIAVVTTPSGVVVGWDAADALAEGWTPARAAALIADATPVSSEQAASNGSRKTSARGLILDLLGEVELWRDPDQLTYATVLIDGHRENLEIVSRPFRAWLTWRAYKATENAPAADVIEATVRLADALALRGPCHRVWRRVGEHSGRIYLDLCDTHWRAVEIDAIGWRVIDTAPCKFVRARGMEELPAPETGEMIKRLREFVNVGSDADFCLICAFLAGSLRPRGPYPILTIGGEQGSSKSTLARVLRALIDPNTAPIRSPPQSERDLMISASNSWLLAFDNLSAVPGWLSDAFCRLATGGGFSTRANYSDRDEMLFSGQRSLMLNGIGDLASRGDLAERTMPVFLPAIPNDQRREESEFWAAFEAAKPSILGALLNAVSRGLRRLPDVRLDRRPRMADFATFERDK
jgi:putative DNA primase/helicase